MKDELRSESQAEMGGASLPAVLSSIAASATGEAFASKVGQIDALGQNAAKSYAATL
jgi:hypothetical protein